MGSAAPLLGHLTTLLAVLCLPVVLVCLYDKFVLEKQRPALQPGMQPVEPALYIRVAWNLLPFVILAVIVKIGVGVVFDYAKQVAEPLSWVAVPVGLICALDSWIFAPRRVIEKGAVAAKDPFWLRACYFVLPVLVAAIIVRMISAESLDFSLVLLLLSLVTGLVWLIDHFVFKKQRERAMQKGVGGAMELAEPGTVDYARSFFPVAVVVLVVRSFVFEPFRIPSDSMMPTLLDGDFIVVNKFAYGLRLPVVNEKFIATGEPQRGDVVVFRYPPEPNVNYIKRLVGLPGDRVEVRGDRLIINGENVPLEEKERYTDGCYVGMRVSEEKLGEHTHRVMSCHSPRQLIAARGLSFTGEQAELTAACDRKRVVAEYGAFICDESNSEGGADAGDYPVRVVPEGQYLMIGDNRDNSLDGRSWGFVPDENIVGKATRIWFNLDPQRSKPINWGRIGNGIE
jgi:signal peptidase I